MSVVVLTCAGPPQLRSCLLGLARSQVAPAEVIVVDGSPGGGTAEMLAREFPKVRVLRNAAGPPARREARRIGAAAATGDVVAFLDDDAVPDEHWLDTLREHYADPAVTGVGGRLLSRNPAKQGSRQLPGRLLADGRLVANFRENPGRSVLVHHLSGVNMSFRRDLLVRRGLVGHGYSGNAVWEDADVCWRVRRSGGLLVFDPRAIVHYEPGRPRTGGRKPPRAVLRHYAVRNNLALLIRHHETGRALPALFGYATVRAQLDRFSEATESRGAVGRPAARARGTARNLAIVGGELSGLLLGAVDGVVGRRADRRARALIGRRA